jgi:hypothetical protein
LPSNSKAKIKSFPVTRFSILPLKTVTLVYFIPINACGAPHNLKAKIINRQERPGFSLFLLRELSQSATLNRYDFAIRIGIPKHQLYNIVLIT